MARLDVSRGVPFVFIREATCEGFCLPPQRGSPMKAQAIGLGGKDYTRLKPRRGGPIVSQLDSTDDRDLDNLRSVAPATEGIAH